MSITYDLTSGTIETKIDLLDRQPFINKMLQIAETLSKSKKNACYALNGAWGAGKSFVIDEFERQIMQYGQNDTTLDRFLLFHYDCWKYDYYAEPLTAIISVMLETIEHKVHLLSDNTKRSIIPILKAIGIYALDHFDKRIERKVGISPKDVYEAIVNAKSDVLSQIDESHEFDSYYAINETLNRLREAITQLSEHQTILLVVDELDRCLPEYTIKVLERLHHVFEGIPNVQIIVATDKKQLGHVVRQIYGDETSVEKYLEKFIQFELTLKEGSINEDFDILFSSYTSKFSLEQSYECHNFIKILLSGIDIRTRISIINRCELIHTLMSAKFTTDVTAVHMCAEIFLTMLKHFRLTLRSGPNWDTDPLSMGLGINMDNREKAGHTGLYKINEKWHENYSSLCNSYDHFKECNIQSILGLILACYWHICAIPSIHWVRGPYSLHQVEFEQYIDEFWNFLDIVH